MKNQKTRLAVFSKRRLWIGMSLVLLLVLISMSMAAAQSTPMPLNDVPLAGSLSADEWGNQFDPEAVTTQQDEGECDDLTDADHGKKMKCSHKKLTEAICATKDLAEQDESGVFTDRQKNRFAKQCAESQDWVNAPGREEDFREMLKKQGAQCYTEEIIDDVDDDENPIGNDDGICSQGEKHKDGCVEDDEDGLGNDNGVCEELGKQKGKKTWEACLVTCDVEGGENGVEGDLYDNGRAELVENAVDEAAETLIDLNDQFSTMTQALQVQQEALVSVGEVYEPDQCLGLLLFEADPRFASHLANDTYNLDHEERPYAFETLNDWRVAANYAQAGEICDDAFSYSWSFGIGGETGGSSQAWCIIAHYADYIVQDVADGLEILDDAVTGTRIDNAVKCLQFLGEEVQSIGSGVDEANVKLTEVLDNQAAMMTQLDEINRLLNLAPGKRPDFPGCDNDNKCDPNEDAQSCPLDCSG